jgi:hypothetical protein
VVALALMTSGMGLLSPGSPSFTVVKILGNVKILWPRLCLGSDAKGFCDELDLILDVTLLCILNCSFLTHPPTEVRGIACCLLLVVGCLYF